jgi:antitoxin MazE
VVEALERQEGDDIEIHIEGSGSLSVRKVFNNRALLARLRKYRGCVPEGFRLDRIEGHETCSARRKPLPRVRRG